jgi:hypothetical protein
MKERKTITKLAALIIGVVTTLTSSLLTAGYQDGTKNELNAAVGPETEGYQLAISTTNKLLISGTPVVLNVSLKNVSTNTLPVSVTSSWFNLYHLDVIGPDGKNASLTDWGKRTGVNTLKGETSRSIKQLAPGSQLDMPFVLSELFEMKSPGDYQITFKQKPWKQRLHPEVALEVVSGPLSIRLIEPTKPTSGSYTNKVDYSK